MIGPGGFMAGPQARGHVERCEWNPTLHEAAVTPSRQTDCPNVTSVCIGAQGTWHVCDSCAQDPAFNRFKIRTRLPVQGDESR